MVSKLLRLIIMGPPGSGKGTISSRIVKDFELKHLSSGDLLRSQIAGKTDAGLDAKSYIDQGRLVPDETMIALILNELRGMRSSSWLLDGFPRTIAQSKSLHSSEPADAVVNLDVPFPVIINRIKGRWTHAASGRIYHTEFNPPQKPGVDDITGEALIQRDDDREEVVTKRLETYQSLTEPVLQFYRDLGLLQEFKGKYSNEIWPRVHQYLSTIATPLQYTEYK